VRVARDQRGASLIAVLLIGAVLAALAATITVMTEAEVVRAGAATRQSTALQAAEAGIDDYIAKLTEDRQFYAHFVHPAEDDRSPAGSQTTDVQGVRRWTGDLVWAYGATPSRWVPLANGYEYHLEVEAPIPTRSGVRIRSSGRRIGDPVDVRTLEVLVRASTIADFFMITNNDIRYGSTAVTYGKVYAGIDESSGTPRDIEHDGIAHADLYAEGQILNAGSVRYEDGAGGYSGHDATGNALADDDPAQIRIKVSEPIRFGDFIVALAEIRRAAEFGGGLLLDNASVHAWRLTFRSNGTVDVARCTRSGSNNVAAVRPTCTAHGTYPVPSIGAIYAEQSVIISGSGVGGAASQVSWVNGRVTVASNSDIVVANDIDYVTNGEDVLGLIARKDVIIAKWTPTNLNWSASVIAQTGRRRTWDSSGSHGTAIFTGSVATNGSPYMDMFAVREYNYDENLLYLQPPYFPVLEEAYTVLFYREL
jgi:hypothetical protein